MSSERPTLILAPGCTERTSASVLDVVLIHGLGGDRRSTWGDGDLFWPAWLAEDFPDCAVYSAGFDSNKLAGLLAGQGASIRDIASAIAEGLLTLPARAPSMILVAHSLGGLVIKQMLRAYSNSGSDRHRQLVASVRGVAFLATPHQGAGIASTLSTILGLMVSKQVKQLQYSSEELLDLQSGFANWANGAGVDVRPFYETQKTGGIHIVDKVTANPNVNGAEPAAVQADHIQICKPTSREALVYASVADMIERQRSVSVTLPGRSLVPVKSGGDVTPFVMFGESSPEEVVLARSISVARSAEPARLVERDELAPDILSDFEYYTATAADDRRDLERKLTDAGRSYQIRDAKRKKERFNMALQRHIAQPSAVTRYTRLLADVETRFNRHVPRLLAGGADAAAIDQLVETAVIEPCVAQHGSAAGDISAALVDSALYYLAGNCHVGWDDV